MCAMAAADILSPKPLRRSYLLTGIAACCR
jgi:hypothetical protein